MEFESHGILSVTTGILMGDIGEVYSVMSYLLDRPAYTHELAHYNEKAIAALTMCHPELPTEATGEKWKAVRCRFISKHGERFELNEALKGVLADDKDPISALREMGFKGDVVAFSF